MRRLNQAHESSRLSLHAIVDAGDKEEDQIDGEIDQSISNVSEMFPQMDAAKSMRDMLDMKSFLD